MLQRYNLGYLLVYLWSKVHFVLLILRFSWHARQLVTLRLILKDLKTIDSKLCTHSYSSVFSIECGCMCDTTTFNRFEMLGISEYNFRIYTYKLYNIYKLDQRMLYRELHNKFEVFSSLNI